MKLNLSDKNALVCGSSQGIGKACAIKLAQMGANICVVARNKENLKQTLDELDKSKGQNHQMIVADFDHPKQVKTKIEDFLEHKTSLIHILVNNSGGPPGGAIIDAKPADFTLALNRHLICNQILVQSVLKGMQMEQFGRIINIISTSVKIPIPNLGVSNTTRGAVASWAKSLSNELATFGITVNNVLPGYTYTERLESIIQTWAKMKGISRDEMAESMINAVPAKRFGKPEEIANVVGFLASTEAAYVNGTSIRVDGGKTGSI